MKVVEDEEGSSSNAGLARVDDLLNEVALRMIMKLNDATFRPVFEKLMDWADAGLPKSDAKGRNLRLLSVFNFLLAFFTRFASIVTKYATDIIKPAVSVLRKPDGENRDLWRKVLQTLTKCFEHDQEDFWPGPVHFGPVASALTLQFSFAQTLSIHEVQAYLVPAVVELAVAADSLDHFKEINDAMLKHLRSPHAPVRLAAVKAEQSLTRQLGEDGNWLSLITSMLPTISELQEDDDEEVERETHRWMVLIEEVTGDNMDERLM